MTDQEREDALLAAFRKVSGDERLTLVLFAQRLAQRATAENPQPDRTHGGAA